MLLLVLQLLPQHHQLVSEDSKALLHEQVVRDTSMLQSYPDYLDLPYNVPSCDYTLDTQSWYPYLQVNHSNSKANIKYNISNHVAYYFAVWVNDCLSGKLYRVHFKS